MTTPDSGANRDKYCGGKKRGPEGGNCTRPAGWGSPHPGIGRCKLHGGNVPSSVKAAQRIMAEEAARTFGLPIKGVPASVAILDEFAWIMGHLSWLREKVQEIEPEALVWGLTGEDHKSTGEFPGVDKKFQAAPNVWLKLYLEQHRLFLDYVKVIETLKIQQAQLDLADRISVVIASRIRVFTAQLALSPEQAALIPNALAAIRGELTVGITDEVAV